MELREKVARAISEVPGRYKIWEQWLPEADAAIAAMIPQPALVSAADEARWVVEQAVRLMAVPGIGRSNGNRPLFSEAVDAITAEMHRVRTDLEAGR